MSDLTGSTFGRYRFTEKLGEGGMATVYKAFDTRLERDVAIKLMRLEQFPQSQVEQALQRFEREAKSLAKLSHPHIVSILDYGDYEGTPYLVMEYLPGGTLKNKLGVPVPWREAAALILPVARALAYAHERGVIHRDVKPANILLRENGEPVLSDFGIAKLMEGFESGNTLTASGVGIGTPEYMSPEQGMGEKVDGRADMYALGTVLYELITGRKPYVADTPMAVLLKHMTGELPAPREFVPNLPEPAEALVLKAMAKKPEERYATMGEFASALEALLYPPTEPVRAAQHTMMAASKQAEATRAPSAAIPPHSAAAPPSEKKGATLAIALGVGAVLLLLCGALGAGALFLFSSGDSNPSASAAATPVQPAFTQSSAPASRPTSIPPTPIPPYVIEGCNPPEDCPNAHNIRSLFPEGTELVPNVEYPISISPQTQALFYTGWCAIDEPTLDENMQKIDFVFEAGEDDVLKYAKTRRYSKRDENTGETYYCETIGAVIRDWRPNQTYRVVIGLRFKEEVNDGWDTYAPGDDLMAYIISADPSVPAP